MANPVSLRRLLNDSTAVFFHDEEKRNRLRGVLSQLFNHTFQPHNVNLVGGAFAELQVFFSEDFDTTLDGKRFHIPSSVQYSVTKKGVAFRDLAFSPQYPGGENGIKEIEMVEGAYRIIPWVPGRP